MGAVGVAKTCSRLPAPIESGASWMLGAGPRWAPEMESNMKIGRTIGAMFFPPFFFRYVTCTFSSVMVISPLYAYSMSCLSDDGSMSCRVTTSRFRSSMSSEMRACEGKENHWNWIGQEFDFDSGRVRCDLYVEPSKS